MIILIVIMKNINDNDDVSIAKKIAKKSLKNDGTSVNTKMRPKYKLKRSLSITADILCRK